MKATKSTVLLVEPDKELSTAVPRILTSVGYSVTTVKDAEAALESCAKEMPQILLTEGLLSKMNGLDLAKAVRAMPNGGLVTIVLTSAVYTGSKFKKQIKDSGIDEVLHKPFTLEELVEKMNALELHSKEEIPTEKEPWTIPSTGLIAENPFIRLVLYFYATKDSGTLRLQNATAKKLVTFELGEPKFVVSNLERECLGQILVKKGRLTAEECDRSLELMTQLKKRQGEALIQLGLLEPYELDEALKHQAREKFCEIFGWREGQYLFVPGKVFKKELTPVDVSVAQLCLRGVKEYYPLAVLQEALGGFLRSKPTLQKDGPFKLEDFRLATWDSKIVRQIQVGKSVSEILDMKLARDVDIYHLFFALHELKVITFPEAKPPIAKPLPAQEEKKPSKSDLSSASFELLGVSWTATDEEVRTAYAAKLKEAETIGNSEERIRLIRKAFAEIGSVEGRRDYLVRVYEKLGAFPKDAAQNFNARDFVGLGAKFIERKDLVRARKIFDEAARLFPEEGILFSYLGYTAVLTSQSKGGEDSEERQRGIRVMIKAVQMSPQEAEAHFLLGKVFVIEKDYEKAQIEFSKTLSLQPEHGAAATELRVLQMRLEKQKNTSFIKWKR